MKSCDVVIYTFNGHFENEHLVKSRYELLNKLFDLTILYWLHLLVKFDTDLAIESKYDTEFFYLVV